MGGAARVTPARTALEQGTGAAGEVRAGHGHVLAVEQTSQHGEAKGARVPSDGGRCKFEKLHTYTIASKLELLV